MIYFWGTTHAAQHLRMAAAVRGNTIAPDITKAEVIFICQDTPTNPDGERHQEPIAADLGYVMAQRSDARPKPQIVITSQVEPGWTRAHSLNWPIFHQAETLRIKDAFFRAIEPDYIIVGGEDCPNQSYAKYLLSFQCPLIFGTWEDAEFSKIAVNMMLAAQVDAANMLSEAAQNAGANWGKVSEALRCDKRIGPHSYLTPGRWQDSLHLLRDAKSLKKYAQR